MAQTVTDFGAWSLLPPALAIAAAIITRRVYQSLLLGIFVAGIMVAGAAASGWTTPFAALAGGAIQTIQWIVFGIADGGHPSVIAFTLFLGAFVAVMQRSGAIRGFGEAAMKYAQDRRFAQGLAWGLGSAFLAIDDYFHVIAAGSVFRPLTDDAKVSREKLAYIIDSTAAPMVIMMPISTWVGVVLSTVAGVAAVEASGRSAFSIFIEGIGFNFYAIMTVVFVGFTAFLPMEFGPMRKAQERALKEGKLLSDTAKPLMSKEVSEMPMSPTATPRASSLLLPLGFLFAATIAMLYVTGAGIEGYGFRAAMANASAELSLAVASFLTLIFALLLYSLRGDMHHDDFTDTVLAGFKAMVPALALLALAWGIGNAVGTTQAALEASGDAVAAHTGGVGLGDWLGATVADDLSAPVVPLLAFILSAVIAFSTGTSFGTFAIMIPVTLSVAAGTTDGVEWFAATLAATLGGAVFGDHCSPISDTTVMSSMAAQCDHIDHVRTQLPYALTVALVAIAGYGVLALTEATWLAWVVNAVLLATVVVVASLVGWRRGTPA